MNTRGFPGMLAPRYQELACGNNVAAALVLHSATHWSTASAPASMVVTLCSSR
ncbi:Uncharacterised protein [Mycobacteroides abscessus subsp. abscessus]|nr:Uncharacterised protein [Mycobacteroides abscessus subsp. abscessus]